MRIRELADVLRLVDELPREQQLLCVRSLIAYVDGWEARIQESTMSDREWARLKFTRRRPNSNLPGGKV